MKRWMAVLLLVSMLAAMLAGCGQDVPADVVDPPAEPDAPVMEDTPSDFEEPTTSPQEPVAPPQEPDTPAEPDDEEFGEYLICEKDGLRILLTGIVIDGYYSNGGPKEKGSAIQIRLENTTESDVSYQLWRIVVNGVTMQGSAEILASAGETKESWMAFRQLHRAGIEKVDEIIFADAWVRGDAGFAPEPTTISIGETVQPIDRTGDVVYEGNGITLIYQGLYQDGDFTYPKLLLVNDTGCTIMAEWMNVTVNGQPQENYWITTTQNDSVHVMTPEYLVPGHFDSLDTLSFHLYVSDFNASSDSFMFETETIEITLN